MGYQDEVAYISLKAFLFLIACIFAVAAVLLIILSASATSGSGETPASAVSLIDGANVGVLGPGEQRWFKFNPAPGQASQVEKFLTLIFTPDDGNRIRQVTLQLFEEAQLPFFYQGDASKMTNFGAGQVVSRDNNPVTGELFWTGWLFGQNSYYIQIVNGSEVAIDYHLFPDNVINFALGQPEAPTPAPVFAEGATLQTALPLKVGVNKGGLDVGQEAWYSFRVTDFDEEYFEEMALTMITTPDDGNRIHHITFDIFTGDQVQHGASGDSSQLHNMGAGSVVFRDDNPLTGERFWTGWVVDNDLYYVQIRNGTDVHMDYWLFTGDVYGPELGEKTETVAQVAATPGAAPDSALGLEIGINRGRLNPKEERWYTLSRVDGENFGQVVETTFTLIFTPDDGNRNRYVNFELFEGNQLRDWAPDNRFNLINFGQGSVVSRDGDLNTGESIWNGHVISGNVYYLRVSNETDVVIDYWIFPDDVINANLD